MKPLRSLLLIGLLLTSGTSFADVLLIDSIAHEPPNSSEGIMRPTNGMSMEAVEAKYGAPSEKIPAVGEPPISRWIYGQFTVYFENNLVIHSTLHHP